MKINLIQFLPCQLKCFFCLNSRNHGLKFDRFSFEKFKDVIDICAEYDFNEIDLTPNIGDFLLDKEHLKKLEYLENHPGIRWYGFVTNFINVSDDFLDFVISMEKGIIEPSVYGYNKNQYKETTGNDYFYEFYENILRLKLSRPPKMRVRFYLRCETKKDSVLYEMMKEMVDFHGAKFEIYEWQNKNWGGLISENEHPNIGCHRWGICSHAFTDIGIFTNGDVTLCNCWDSYRKMILGNIFKQDVKDIFKEDSEYGNIIKEQMFRKYRGICRKCDDFTNISPDEIPFEWIKKYRNIIERIRP
jgi:radical SAM protein with 4Fe4S-binding SPASM domain